MPFEATYVRGIESALQQEHPNRWRRLDQAELISPPLKKFSVGWRIEVPANSLRIEGVDYLNIALDHTFPNSQPRVFAPQAGSNFRWPHVELEGLLCLKATKLAAAPPLRVLQHLRWAEELLNYDDLKCRQEFEREFVAYWNQRSGPKAKRPDVLSLLKPGGESREIVYVNDRANGRIVIADSKPELMSWLRNNSVILSDRELMPTCLLRLSRPWTPSQYPEFGRDVLNRIPEATLRHVLTPNQTTPLLFEAKTQTGSAFAAVLVRSPAERKFIKGFRSIEKVPINRILATVNSVTVQRCPVTRIDGPWIHGRGHDQDYPNMRSKSVVMIGCGAIGGYILKLLAQAGVGKFLLIDSDNLSSANISRHVLGARTIGKNKAEALAQMLRQDFPHLELVKHYPKQFQKLSAQELEAVSKADLIISAGIDFEGDSQIDNWRRKLGQPIPHLCTWTEAHAIVGHAVMLFGSDSLLTGFDGEQLPKFRLTDWPDNDRTLIIEAGCGNVFQPHGAIDLQPTVTIAARLAVDVLLERVPDSCRRVWQGDLTEVAANGGTAKFEFTESNVTKEAKWS
jgi:ThiF family/Prokaryotic E2 family B